MANHRLGFRGALAFILFLPMLVPHLARAGSYIAALPETEYRALIDKCVMGFRGIPGPTAMIYNCEIQDLKGRWMALYNRLIDYMNKNQDLPCDEVDQAFQATLDRVDGEWTDFWQNQMKGGNPDLATFVREMQTRLTDNRARRETSCPSQQANKPTPSAQLSAPPPAALDSAPRNPDPPRARAVAEVAQDFALQGKSAQDFQRKALANLTLCADRPKPDCDSALLACLRSCRQDQNADRCNQGCQERLLTCKGCSE